MPRAPIRQTPQEEWLVAGPFVGVRDRADVLTAQPDLAFAAQNCYLPSGPLGMPFTGRPGFAQAQAVQLGSGGTRRAQGGITWTRSDGTRQTVAIVGGKVYTFDYGTATWTESLSAATLSAASVTLSTTARVALVPFAGVLVVSDGVNDPWTWTGATNAGVDEIAGVGAWYGPPVVYYSKLFAIKASDRRTLVWSEEADPQLGYDIGGYNNAWDNPGGYTAPLTALAATNDALYVFRERIAITITGAVNEDFATAGTRASLSETTGTTAPWAVVVLPEGAGANGVAFLDANGRPHLAVHGAGVTPLWEDCAETVAMIPRASLPNAEALLDGTTRCLLFAVPGSGATWPNMYLCFPLDRLRYAGTWGWDAEAQRSFAVVDADGVGRWMHAGVDDGRVYLHGTATAGPWNDGLAAETRYIAHRVVGPALGLDAERERMVASIEALFPVNGQTTASVSYETPRGTSAPLVATLNATSGGFVVNVSQVNVGVLGTRPSEQRVRVGTAGRGRWIRPVIAHQEDGEPFGVAWLRVRTFTDAAHPGVV